MANCFECNSERIVELHANCPDGCKIYIGDDIFHEGDIPTDMNIGGPDFLAIEFCLSCGILQSNFPVEETELEASKEKEENILKVLLLKKRK